MMSCKNDLDAETTVTVDSQELSRPKREFIMKKTVLKKNKKKWLRFPKKCLQSLLTNLCTMMEGFETTIQRQSSLSEDEKVKDTIDNLQESEPKPHVVCKIVCALLVSALTSPAFFSEVNPRQIDATVCQKCQDSIDESLNHLSNDLRGRLRPISVRALLDLRPSQRSDLSTWLDKKYVVLAGYNPVPLHTPASTAPTRPRREGLFPRDLSM